MRVTSVVATVALAIFSSGVAAFEDHFDGPTIDPNWEIVTVGQGPAVTQGGGELLVAIPGNSIGAGNWGAIEGPWMSAGCRANCELTGDFDFAVDYRLVNWPAQNGVRAGIGTLQGEFEPVRLGVVHRMRTGPAEIQDPSDYFVVHANTGPIGVSTNVTAGSLRLVRSGSVWTGYHSEGADWVQIGAVTGPTGPIRPEIRLWAHASSFAGQNVSVAFDDFVVSGGVGCEGVVPVTETSFGSFKASYR